MKVIKNIYKFFTEVDISNLEGSSIVDKLIRWHVAIVITLFLSVGLALALIFWGEPYGLIWFIYGFVGTLLAPHEIGIGKFNVKFLYALPMAIWFIPVGNFLVWTVKRKQNE